MCRQQISRVSTSSTGAPVLSTAEPGIYVIRPNLKTTHRSARRGRCLRSLGNLTTTQTFTHTPGRNTGRSAPERSHPDHTLTSARTHQSHPSPPRPTPTSQRPEPPPSPTPHRPPGGGSVQGHPRQISGHDGEVGEQWSQIAPWAIQVLNVDLLTHRNSHTNMAKMTSYTRVTSCSHTM